MHILSFRYLSADFVVLVERFTALGILLSAEIAKLPSGSDRLVDLKARYMTLASTFNTARLAHKSAKDQFQNNNFCGDTMNLTDNNNAFKRALDLLISSFDAYLGVL